MVGVLAAQGQTMATVCQSFSSVHSISSAKMPLHVCPVAVDGGRPVAVEGGVTRSDRAAGLLVMSCIMSVYVATPTLAHLQSPHFVQHGWPNPRLLSVLRMFCACAMLSPATSPYPTHSCRFRGSEFGTGAQDTRTAGGLPLAPDVSGLCLGQPPPPPPMTSTATRLPSKKWTA